jgi:hypothetical protein
MVQVTIVVKAKTMESLDEAILEVYEKIGDVKTPSPLIISKGQTDFEKGDVDSCYTIVL